MATTEELQGEEDYIAGDAAGGRGTRRPVGVADGLTRTLADGKSLNDGQWEAVTGLLDFGEPRQPGRGPGRGGQSRRCSANTTKACSGPGRR